jgi:hypothetical protein
MRPEDKSTPEPTHDCPCGCESQIPHHELACNPGWFRLPPRIRTDINEAWRSMRHGRDAAARSAGTTRHHAALMEALDWYRDNLRGS